MKNKTGRDEITFEKMESVREQQEKLARLHFDFMIGSNDSSSSYFHSSSSSTGQHSFNQDSNFNPSSNNNIMIDKLMGNLQQLSQSIEQLQSANPSSHHHPNRGHHGYPPPPHLPPSSSSSGPNKK